jgi:hypothetical protein
VAQKTAGTVDEKIGMAQWAWARELAEEWMATEAAGKAFKLWPDQQGVLLFCHLLEFLPFNQPN